MKKNLVKCILSAISLTVILATCSKKDNPAPNTGNGNNTTPGTNMGEIMTYENITLGGINQKEAIGNAFSTKTGNIIKSGDITAANGPEIDLVYLGFSGGLSFFESPDSLSKWSEPQIPGAKKVEIVNYQSTFTGAMFDGMTNDEPIKNLTINYDRESFYVGNFPVVVLFKNQFNKKGVIKIKSGTPGASGNIVCDIKVQK